MDPSTPRPTLESCPGQGGQGESGAKGRKAPCTTEGGARTVSTHPSQGRDPHAAATWRWQEELVLPAPSVDR